MGKVTVVRKLDDDSFEAPFVDDVVGLALARKEPENLATCGFDDAFSFSTAHSTLHDELGRKVYEQAEGSHASMLLLQKYGLNATVFHRDNLLAAFAATAFSSTRVTLPELLDKRHFVDLAQCCNTGIDLEKSVLS